MTTMTTEPQSREEIQRQFDRIVRRHEAQGTQIATKAEQAERLKHDELVDLAAGYTVESIVNGLAKLQLGFGTAVDGIAVKLDEESGKLEQLRRAITVQRDRLEQLRSTFIAAEALAIVEQDHRNKLEAWREQADATREALATEQEQTRREWSQQQQEQARQDEEYAAQVLKDRTQADQDHAYEVARQNRVDADARTTSRQQVERELSEQEAIKAKDWAAREKVLSDDAERVAELRERVEAMPQTLEQAIKHAREKAIAAVHRETKFELEMLDKQHAGNVSVAELKVQTLQDRIVQQTERIAELDRKLDQTIAKSQGLAEQAFNRPGA